LPDASYWVKLEFLNSFISLFAHFSISSLSDLQALVFEVILSDGCWCMGHWCSYDGVYIGYWRGLGCDVPKF